MHFKTCFKYSLSQYKNVFICCHFIVFFNSLPVFFQVVFPVVALKWRRILSTSNYFVTTWHKSCVTRPERNTGKFYRKGVILACICCGKKLDKFRPNENFGLVFKLWEISSEVEREVALDLMNYPMILLSLFRYCNDYDVEIVDLDANTGDVLCVAVVLVMATVLTKRVSQYQTYSISSLQRHQYQVSCETFCHIYFSFSDYYSKAAPNPLCHSYSTCILISGWIQILLEHRHRRLLCRRQRTS